MIWRWLKSCGVSGHKWSKWTEYKRVIEWVDAGYETDERGQKRKCEKCGLIQRKREYR